MMIRWWIALFFWDMMCLLSLSTQLDNWHDPQLGIGWTLSLDQSSEQAFLAAPDLTLPPDRSGPDRHVVLNRPLTVNDTGPPCHGTQGPPGPKWVLNELPAKPATQQAPPSLFCRKFPPKTPDFPIMGFCNSL
jgi:hypothetical protein